MLTWFNVQKHIYISNTVHYCRSSMPRLSQMLRFLQVPPSNKCSLLWLANWPSALWLAEHHKPRRKCNAPFHNCKLQLSKNKDSYYKDMWGRVWMSRFRGAWQNLNFDKEYLFGFETLVFATSGILSMHNQLVTLQRERKTWNRIIWPL